MVTEPQDENEKLVYKALKESEKPMRPGDVAKETGLDSKVVSQAIKALKNRGLVCSPKRCYYGPSDE
ncbi:Mn-dependent DtxR family transcriptional regulator [Methanohalophilus levihalophilus]|uniref:helix-turn-helix transcriptional regulator n=1 Tax=Methanohalophilus levihalophilus TaxID=1431282 RepID=UPI001AE25412|nr:MarR family transcriptional regulator [Methanohalophilus levihalophilus]MBP2030485.1 Mn-dependent DtxR family transcriptional regulator [Methanohalophilus levihalophilus]